ncbi:MAG TPA: thioredoxin family protein [Actinomycetota bacterium]|jgi:glutaredoxin-like protein
MSLLATDDRDLVERYFAQKLTVPVQLLTFTDEGDTGGTPFQSGTSSRQTRELVEELAALSDLISLEVYDVAEHAGLVEEWGILAAPTIAIGPGDDTAPPRVRYVGYPGGHEFTSLLETLGSVGRENWGLTPETVELLAKVDRSIDVKTFVTPTCIYCPKAVLMAHRMALASSGIRSTCVESEEMSHLASKYQIMMVPKMVVNEAYDFVGALPEVQFVTQVLQGSLAT